MFSRNCPSCKECLPRNFHTHFFRNFSAPCPSCNEALTPHPADGLVNYIFLGIAIGLAIVGLTEIRGLMAAAITGVSLIVAHPFMRVFNSFFRMSIYKNGRINF